MYEMILKYVKGVEALEGLMYYCLLGSLGGCYGTGFVI